MDDRDRLALYPFVVVRIACRRVCSRWGSYRLDLISWSNTHSNYRKNALHTIRDDGIAV